MAGHHLSVIGFASPFSDFDLALNFRKIRQTKGVVQHPSYAVYGADLLLYNVWS